MLKALGPGSVTDCVRTIKTFKTCTSHIFRGLRPMPPTWTRIEDPGRDRCVFRCRCHCLFCCWYYRMSYVVVTFVMFFMLVVFGAGLVCFPGLLRLLLLPLSFWLLLLLWFCCVVLCCVVCCRWCCCGCFCFVVAGVLVGVVIVVAAVVIRVLVV